MKFKIALFVLAIGGCASPVRGNPDDNSKPDMTFGGSDDLSAPPDLKGGSTDLAGNKADLLTAFDLTTGNVDLATSNPDMTVAQADMTVAQADMVMSSTDMAGMCTPPVAGGQCDTWVQCGCMGGLACTVTDTTSGLTGCVTAGSTNPYSSCTGTGTGQCQPGFTCVDSVCKQYCNGGADCGGNFRQCGQVSVNNNPVPQMYICSRLCDPVNPQLDDATFDACGPGTTCYPATAATKASDCIGGITTPGVHGDDCSAFGGSAPDYRLCGPGTICLGDNPVFAFVGSCYKFCHVGSNADCTGGAAAGKTCKSFATKQYAGATEVGYCN